MDDPLQVITGFPFMFVFGIDFIARLVGGGSNCGVALHLAPGDNCDVKMGTRNVCLTSCSFRRSCSMTMGVDDAIGAGGYLASLGQLRNSRLPALPLGRLVCSARFRLAASRTAGASAPRPADG